MDIAEFYRPSAIAKQRGIPVQTLISAIRRGRCKSWKTACGQKLTTENAVENWIKSEGLSFRGRPRGDWMDGIDNEG